MHPSSNDIGAYVKPVKGTPPGSIAAGAVNGAAIDRLGFGSCVLKASTGADTGSPSARSLDAKLQDSADGSTGWADYNPAGAGSGAIAQIAAVNSEAQKDIDLSGAKRFIRVVATTAFTGGTAPTLGQCTEVVPGGAVSQPA